MTNSKYRCAGCRDYKPYSTVRRLGGVRVCSEECGALYLERHRQRSLKPRSRRAATPATSSGSPIPMTVRTEVSDRDRSRCRFCGTEGGHLHHIRYRSEGVDHQAHNLITLCQEHHDMVHANKRVWKPWLLATMWLEYVEGRHLTVLAVRRIVLHTGYVLRP